MRNTQASNISEELFLLIKSSSTFREEKILQVILTTKPTIVLHRYYTFNEILKAKSNLFHHMPLIIKGSKEDKAH